MDITQRLMDMRDEKYRDFTAKLIPGIDRDTIMGVRIPNIRALSAELIKNGEYPDFINILPHTYFEEYHLHSFIISAMKDVDICINEIEKLLPYIDNWSVCDSLRPKCFAKNKEKLLIFIKSCLKSEEAYTKRFGIEMLMIHFLDDDFSTEFLKMVSKVEGDNYYLKMMVAWYFATALAKQYEATLPFIENRYVQDRWTHNKAIQKACESNCVSDDKKAYLKTLRI